MVLFKRKPVSFPEPPGLPEDSNVKVWYIPYTREWFLTYDEYLARMDYYNTKKFVCEITGNSCLTFFEAFDSETKEMRIVEENFPEHLKEPILRHLQFSTVPRIDQLVDNVYSTFKNDYYPGETVMIRLSDYKNDFKVRCIIREKAKFNAVVDANNVLRPAYCQYRVSRVDNGMEMVVDEAQLTRDRNNFTKWFVKTFIKLSVTRSPRLGAPWIVKQKYAEKYRIPTDLPKELAHFKEKPKLAKKSQVVPIRSKDSTSKSKKPEGYKTAPGKKAGAKIKVEVIKPPPPPKRTIQEDLELSLETTLKKPVPGKLKELGNTVQEALEAWTFLNIYRVPLILDTFSFDDFLTALNWDSTRRRCSLLDEIFSAVLSTFLQQEGKTVNVPIPEDFQDEEEKIPQEDEETETVLRKQENGSNENGKVKEEDTNGHNVGNGKTAPQKKEEQEEEESDEDIEEVDEEDNEDTNRVDEYLTYRNTSWTERLKNRSFKDGNYQIILLGVLDEVRDISAFKGTIKEIFDILAPLDGSVSPGTLQHKFFTKLSLRLRIKALSILCTLLVNTTPIRSYLEKCMEESAQLRRERSDKIREYKNIYQKAQDIDKECRELTGKNSSAINPSIEGSTETTGTNVVSANGNANSNVSSGKKRRRAGLTIEPTEDELKIAESNEEYAKLLASRTAQLKLAEGLRLDRRSLERKISELDIQRIKYIGKDRMFNRYWWFENNGLPNLGGKGSKNIDDDEDEEEDDDDDDDDDLHLSQETYLMGRLWIQGPSEDDLKYGLKLKNELIKEWEKLSEESDEEDEDEEDDQEKDKLSANEGGLNEKLTPLLKENPGTTIEQDSEVIVVDLIEGSRSGTSEPIEPQLPFKFIRNSSKLFDIKFDSNHSKITSADGRLLVDDHGAFALGISNCQRKIIEERPDPLLTFTDWRYYDTVDQLEQLIKWLNPWGERESKLLKELNTIKDEIVSSVSSRRKALKLDSVSEEEARLLDILDNTVLTDSEAEKSEESDIEDDSTSDGDSEDLIELESLTSIEIADSDSPDGRRTRKSIAEAERLESTRREKEILLRKRIDERQAKRERSKPSQRIAKRELKKRKIKEHEEKKQLIESSKEQLEKIKEDNELQRCLDWINQSAIDILGHSHYEGLKSKSKEKSKRSRR